MATSVVIEAHGKRFPVKPKPMAPIAAALVEVLAALKVDKAPEACQLLLNGKRLDTATPYRFLNLPSGAKLTLVTGCEPAFGVGARPSAAAGGAPPEPVAAPAARAPQPARALDPLPVAGHVAEAGAGPSGSASAGASSSSQRHKPPPASTSQQPAAAGMAPGTAGGAGGAEGGGRQVAVFTREELMASASGDGGGGGDVNDAFFEMTPDDYVATMAGFARMRGQDAHMKTREMREREQQEKAAALAAVTLRLHLPDGHIVQAAFQPTDRLAAVRALLDACLVPGLGRYQLYTAPPKAVLKDEAATLYSLGLAPAANVHIGLPGAPPPGGCLQPEFAAAHRSPPPAEYVATRRRQEQGAAGGAAEKGKAPGGGGSARGAGGGGGSGDGKKLPKWMKLK